MATAFGRAGQVTVSAGNNPIEIIGIAEYLRDAQRANQNFDKEMKKASRQVAASLIIKAKDEAATVTRSRQAIQVMRGMKARSIITPTVSLSHTSPFISKSNPNKKRDADAEKPKVERLPECIDSKGPYNLRNKSMEK